MLSNVLGVWFMVGWLEDTFSEADREWWGTVSSRMMIAAAIWGALFCFAVFSPVVFSWGYKKLFVDPLEFSNVAGPLSSILAVVGAMTTGLYAANSLSVGKKQNPIMRVLAHAAPYLFLFIVFFAICMVWTAGIYFCYEYFHVQIFRGFWETVKGDQTKFLTDLSLTHGIPTTGFPNWVQACVSYLPDFLRPTSVPAIIPLALITGILWFFAFRISTRVGINRFSLQRMYSTRLSRCYLGARRTRRSASLTNLDFRDDFPLHDLFNGHADLPNTNANQIKPAICRNMQIKSRFKSLIVLSICEQQSMKLSWPRKIGCQILFS